MKEEYASIRDEILQWQEYRFLILGATTALIAGVLAFELKDISEHWVGISAMLILFVALAEFVSWYAGDDNVKAAAYLVVFYEEERTAPKEGRGWESRLRRAKENKRFGKHRLVLTLNQWLAVVYLLFGGASMLLPWHAALSRNAELPPLEIGILVSCGLVWVAGLYYLLRPSPRDSYEKAWRKLRQEERQHDEKKTDHPSSRRGDV